jgi:hypothetical protein
MGDEQGVSLSSDQESPAIPPIGEEKPKRKARKGLALKPQELPTTEAGARVADQLRQKLIEMVNDAALTEANRRRATALDSIDHETGFDIIAGPPRRRITVAIVADMAGAVGSGLIGYAINVYIGSSVTWSNGHVAMIGGGMLLVSSILLKYVTPGKGFGG